MIATMKVTFDEALTKRMMDLGENKANILINKLLLYHFEAEEDNANRQKLHDELGGASGKKEGKEGKPEGYLNFLEEGG